MDSSPHSLNQTMDELQVPDGMDPSCTYKMKFRIHPVSKERRKQFPGGYTAIEFIESDTTNYKDFMEWLNDKYPCKHTETVLLTYVDPVSKAHCDVRSDQDLMSLFSKFASTKYFELHVNTIMKGTEQSVVDNSLNAPSISVSEDTGNDGNGKSCNLSKANVADVVQPVLCDSSYLANPFPMFEHVGVNDEAAYGIDVELDEPEAIEAPNNAAEESSSEGEEESGSEEESDSSSEEEERDVTVEVAATNVAPSDEADEWVARDAMPDDIPQPTWDRSDPPMHVGSLYPSVEDFKIALSQHAIKHEFEFLTEKSDPDRVRVYCAAKKTRKCKWRIHASTIADGTTIQVCSCAGWHPQPHTCGSRRRSKKMRNATQDWICDQVLDWMREDATVGAKELQRRLKDKWHVEIKYNRVHAGRQLALDKVYGKWHESFDLLYRWKAEVEKKSPGSVVIIEYHEHKEERRFSRMFVALKACVDGFLKGCRPYLAIDSTFLTGMFRGQLATACSVDGHNWLYPVVYAVMETESGDNWKWFMEKLHSSIGEVSGLAICTDAGKGLDQVKQVFTTAEHRECMRHLVTNFKRKYVRKVYTDNLWPAAYAWQPEVHEAHMENIIQANPDVKTYLDTHHPNIWMRSKMSTACKVDYVTNNIAESFNKWITNLKSLYVVDLVDTLRQKIMIKFAQRRSIADKMQGNILPHILADLDQKSFNLTYNICRKSDNEAEVSGNHWTYTRQLEAFRHVVDIEAKTCTCREWQLSGKPCLHAIAFITSLRDEPFDKYVDKYYSVEMFKLAYAENVPALVDQNQWPKSDHGFFLLPPFLRKTAGRPRTLRIKGSHEHGAKKKTGSKHKCPICEKVGHHWKSCKEGNPEHKEALAQLAAKTKAEKKRATKKAIKQALTVASSGTSSSVKSVCASNEVEDTQTLAIIPVADLSPTRKQPARKKKASIPTEQEKQASDVGNKKKKAPSKKKAPPKKKGPEPSKKRKKAAAQPSTPSKKKKASTEEPSTPVNKKQNVALPDSPAMSTRSKLKL